MTGWQIFGTVMLGIVGLGFFGLITLGLYDDDGWAGIVAFWLIVAGTFCLVGFLILMIALATGTLP